MRQELKGASFLVDPWRISKTNVMSRTFLPLLIAVSFLPRQRGIPMVRILSPLHTKNTPIDLCRTSAGISLHTTLRSHLCCSALQHQSRSILGSASFKFEGEQVRDQFSFQGAKHKKFTCFFHSKNGKSSATKATATISFPTNTKCS